MWLSIHPFTIYLSIYNLSIYLHHSSPFHIYVQIYIFYSFITSISIICNVSIYPSICHLSVCLTSIYLYLAACLFILLLSIFIIYISLYVSMYLSFYHLMYICIHSFHLSLYFYFSSICLSFIIYLHLSLYHLSLYHLSLYCSLYVESSIHTSTIHLSIFCHKSIVCLGYIEISKLSSLFSSLWLWLSSFLSPK